ncbi:MAG: type II secretion system F family protein, partial [Patescibacteria group bacterium]
MLYKYKAIDQTSGEEQNGTIVAVTPDIAIAALQRRRLMIVSVVAADDIPFWKKLEFTGPQVTYRDVVILSRQISTLFRASVPALHIFQLLGGETDNTLLKRRLEEIAEDIQGGTSLSGALGKHSDVFSDFYVNMVRAGEESGDLSKTFSYLADYLDRSYELMTKTRNALIYPAFVVVAFIVVMVLMLVIVIPKLSVIILEVGRELPFYTKIVIGISNLFVNYGILMAIGLTLGVFFSWRYVRTDKGKHFFGQFALSAPYVGILFRKLYLTRIADNLNTMLSAGVTVVRSVEVAASVVGNDVYKNLLLHASMDVRTGVSLSQALSKYPDVIPGIMIQMIKVGEETGELPGILDTLAKFYRREVDNEIDTLISLIEPTMIILLGV